MADYCASCYSPAAMCSCRDSEKIEKLEAERDRLRAALIETWNKVTIAYDFSLDGATDLVTRSVIEARECIEKALAPEGKAL